MSSRIVWWILCACSVAVSSGCGAGLSPSKKAETVEEQRGADGRPAPLDRAASSKEVSQSDRSKPADEIDRRLQDEVIGRVALVRQLAWKRRPTTMRVSRQEAYRRIIAMNERNVPPRVLDATGEMLRALGLIGPKLDWKKTITA